MDVKRQRLTYVCDTQRTMLTRVDKEIRTLDEKRRALLDELETLDVEDLKARPIPDKWSILEIVEHLVVAEREICLGMPEAPDLTARKPSFKDRCIYAIVMFALKHGIPLKAPSSRLLPRGGRPLAELRGQWDENIRWLRSYAAGLDREGLRRRVFMHPATGPITLEEVLRMDQLHVDRHVRQIRRLQSRLS